MNLPGFLAWTAELQRRQDEHVTEVWRLLSAWPREVAVVVECGPHRKTKGVITALDLCLVELSMGSNATRWVPLLQISHVGGRDMDTYARLAVPAVPRV